MPHTVLKMCETLYVKVVPDNYEYHISLSKSILAKEIMLRIEEEQST